MKCNVNCKQYNGFGHCNKKPRTFKIFKQTCEEYGTLSQTCEIAERHPRPVAPPPPAMPPRHR